MYAADGWLATADGNSYHVSSNENKYDPKRVGGFIRCRGRVYQNRVHCNSHETQKIKGDIYAFFDPKEASHSAAIIKH